mgnify:FL=1
MEKGPFKGIFRRFSCFFKKSQKKGKKVLTKGKRRGIIIELSESGTPERSDRHPNGEPVREVSRG